MKYSFLIKEINLKNSIYFRLPFVFRFIFANIIEVFKQNEYSFAQWIQAFRIGRFKVRDESLANSQSKAAIIKEYIQV